MKLDNSDRFLLLKIAAKRPDSVEISFGEVELAFIPLMISELGKPLFKGVIIVDTEKKLVQIQNDGTDLRKFSGWLDENIPGWQEGEVIKPLAA